MKLEMHIVIREPHHWERVGTLVSDLTAHLRPILERFPVLNPENRNAWHDEFCEFVENFQPPIGVAIVDHEGLVYRIGVGWAEVSLAYGFMFDGAVSELVLEAVYRLPDVEHPYGFTDIDAA